MKYLPFVLFLFAFHAGFSGVIRVGGDGGRRSITAAISMSHPGDTVIVAKGVYREGTIKITKSIHLRGEGYPVLDGQHKFEIVLILSDNVTVEGFKIQNGGYSDFNDIAAVRMVNARGVIVRDNILLANFFGIYSQQSAKCVISGNRIRSTASTELNSANGIHCWKSDSLLIQDNEISGHRDGIYFEFVTHSVIKGNNSHHNTRYGLHFMFSDSDTYVNNVFTSNGAGVSVMFTRRVTMLNNTFNENWGSSSYGLLLKEISDSRIEGNRFSRNTSGIFMEGTSRIDVLGNDFVNNGWAMKIQASCSDNRIVRNNFRGNSFDVSTNGSLVLNEFKQNYWDKYEGYDLGRDGFGDVPFRPVSMYSMLVERNPTTLMLFRSFIASLLDRAEKVMPSLTPENLTDNSPSMKPYPI